MTIKNRGGVFGRNPTFNNVEVEGTLTTTGSLSFPADSISGNAINGGTPTTDGLIVDTTTLVVDAANNRVGVGTAIPSGVLAATDGSNSLIVGQSTDNFHAANAHRFYTLSFGAEPVRIDSDGVKFNGDTAAANALDDYEEGSWTPTLVNNGTVTYSNQFGRYTKIGNSITVWFDVACSNYSGGSSDLRIGGLPYTTNIEGNFGFGGSLIRSIGVNLSSGYTSASLIANSTGGSHFTVYELGDNVSSASLNYSALATTGAISGTVTYRTS